MLSEFLDAACDIGLKTLFYPVDYAKVLIQLGHEPLQPRLPTFLGNRSYMYPNVFGYVQHIYRTDGFFGMYRGFGFMWTEFVVKNSVIYLLERILLKFYKSQKDFEEAPNINIAPKINNFSTVVRDKDFEEDPNNDDVDDVSTVILLKFCKSQKDFEEAPNNDDVDDFSTVVRDKSQKDFEEAPDIDDVDSFSTVVIYTAFETITFCVGIICSQPFRVIYLRSLAQFVGRETRFSSIFSAVPDIWKNEGILGFFAGLVPRLVSQALVISITNLLEYALYSIFVKVKRRTDDDCIKRCFDLMSLIIACHLAYPITLTSVVMAVSPSKLEAVSLPNMPSYDSWLACLQHLKDKSQKNRGLFLFFRKYVGPRIYTSGIVMPIEHQK